MTKAKVYLDYNATAPLLDRAKEAVVSVVESGGNPSAVHWSGRSARSTVEKARGSIATLLDAPIGTVIFTSGASESNVLALRGIPAQTVFVSAIEHDSVLNAHPNSQILPVDGNGTLNIDALAAKIGPGDLVSVMAVNNETGVIQPLEEISRIVRDKGARLHIDAVQAVGRIPLSFRALGASAMSISAHKIGGPTGVGALLFDGKTELTAQTRGGGQERGRRGGTENLIGIAGFGAAAQHLLDHGQEDLVRIRALGERLEDGLKTAAREAVLVAADSERVANTVCIALPSLPSEKQVIFMDLAGVAVSAGAACSSGKVKQSHVLSAMGLPYSISGSSLRFSLGWATTDADVDLAIEAYAAMASKAHASNTLSAAE